MSYRVDVRETRNGPFIKGLLRFRTFDEAVAFAEDTYSPSDCQINSDFAQDTHSYALRRLTARRDG